MSKFTLGVERLLDAALTTIPFLNHTFSISLSIMDLLNALRLSLLTRQMRELQQVASQQSFKQSISATLVAAYGGEIIMAVLVKTTPSFMLSPNYIVLLVFSQAIIDGLPAVPSISIFTEIPLAVVDALHLSTVLCDVLPQIATYSVADDCASGTWVIFLTSMIVANGGPFILFTFPRIIWPSEFLPRDLKFPTCFRGYVWFAPAIPLIYLLFTGSQATCIEWWDLFPEPFHHPPRLSAGAARATCATILFILIIIQLVLQYIVALLAQLQCKVSARPKIPTALSNVIKLKIPPVTTLDDLIRFYECGAPEKNLTVPLKDWAAKYDSRSYELPKRRLSEIATVFNEWAIKYERDDTLFDLAYPDLRDQHNALIHAVREARKDRGEVTPRSRKKRSKD